MKANKTDTLVLSDFFYSKFHLISDGICEQMTEIIIKLAYFDSFNQFLYSSQTSSTLGLNCYIVKLNMGVQTVKLNDGRDFPIVGLGK